MYGKSIRLQQISKEKHKSYVIDSNCCINLVVRPICLALIACPAEAFGIYIWRNLTSCLFPMAADSAAAVVYLLLLLWTNRYRLNVIQRMWFQTHTQKKYEQQQLHHHLILDITFVCLLCISVYACACASVCVRCPILTFVRISFVAV